MNKPRIPDEEFRARIIKTQDAMKNEGYDLLLCFGNEAEPQYVRYYSDYHPSFECACVLIAQEGDPLLLIGPESGTFAGDVSRIKEIRKLLVLRESSEPEYPGAVLDTFESVINEITDGKSLKKVGIVGNSLITHSVYADFVQSLKKVCAPTVESADLLVSKIRAIKSENELNCMREAYRISQLAMKNVLDHIKAGMTENQVKGLAMSTIFSEGAEGEAYPFWILTGKGTNQAISRCRGKEIKDGDLVQIQVSSRYQGYASTVGRPVVIGKATEEQKKMIEAALAAQKAILSTAKAGVNASEVAAVHYNTMKKYGCEDFILYGPCHGTGLMEGEYPWIESNSDYPLEENMTFCTCLYLGNDKNEIGLRIEDGYRITRDGTESFSDYRRELIEI